MLDDLYLGWELLLQLRGFWRRILNIFVRKISCGFRFCSDFVGWIQFLTDLMCRIRIGAETNADLQRNYRYS